MFNLFTPGNSNLSQTTPYRKIAENDYTITYLRATLYVSIHGVCRTLCNV